MITGFNTDIRHGERVFHVQTEDRGAANPVVESLVYVGGEILLSKRSPYAELVQGGQVDEKALRQLIDVQHRKVIEAIRRGRFDDKASSGGQSAPGASPPAAELPEPVHVSPAAAAAAAAILAGAPPPPLRRTATRGSAAPAPPPAKAAPPPAKATPPAAPAQAAAAPPRDGRSRPARIPSGIGVAPERTLDQVIVDYLASEAASEHLELQVSRSGEVVAGKTVMLDVKASTSLTASPLAGVHVTIRVVSTSAPAQILFRGTTGPSGVLHATCTIPDFGAANAALIVSASSAIGNHEVKQLVRRRSG